MESTTNTPSGGTLSGFVKLWEDPESQNRLLTLVSKIIRLPLFVYYTKQEKCKRDNVTACLDYLKTSIAKKCRDPEILIGLRQFMKTGAKEEFDPMDRAKHRASEIQVILKRSFKAAPLEASYLDVGAGNGSNTLALGTALRFLPQNIWGVEIAEWMVPQEVSPYLGKQMLITNGRQLPFSDSKFLLITACQVLHHSENQEELLREIHRCLVPGGYFLVREHDCRNIADRNLINLEHALYDVTQDGLTVETFYGRFYANYHSAEKWDEMIKTTGFEKLEIKEPEFKINVTRYYYAMYRKIN